MNTRSMTRSSTTEKIRSKHGFTLVELVVVIAVLGLLAAIAIPAVIGIISNASRSKEESNAAELERACKNYYTMVGSGMINSEEHGASTQSNLPPLHGTTTQRVSAARAATVINVCEYAGLGQIKEELEDGAAIYVFDDEGALYPKQERDDLSDNLVTSETTLGDLYRSLP